MIMDTSYGILNWTVNGSLNLGYDFHAVNGNGFINGADVRLTVNGNLNFTGGNVVLVNKADAPCRVTVTGSTNINNATGNGGLCFIEGGNGTMTFSTLDLNLIAGSNNYLMGKPGSVMESRAIGNFTVTNDFNVSGAAALCFAYADSNTNKIRIAITRDFNLNANASLVGAYTGGAFTFKAGRNMNITNGQFTGQSYMQATGIDSVITGADFTFNSANSSAFFKANRSAGNTFVTSVNYIISNSGLGNSQGVALVDSGAGNLTFIATTFTQNGGQFNGILSGSGNLTFNVSGILDMNGGIFKGNNNTTFSNPGTFAFTLGSIDYDGGLFSCYYNCSTSGIPGTVTIGGVCKINYTSVTDEFTFIGLAGVGFDINNIGLTLSITGAMTIQGMNGTFVSSRSLGNEIVVLSSLTISSGNNSFNSITNSPIPNGHNVTMTVSGSVSISGGNSFLSGYTQTYTGIISGNLTISGGSLSVKGGDCTTSTLNVLGTFNQSSGSFYLHNCTNDELAASATITVNLNSNDDNNGDFIQTGGSIIYDNSTTTPSALNLILNIKSVNYTIGGTGVITMTKPGTGTVFGILNFAHIGLVNFNRSGTHLIQQVTQNVMTGCTLDIVSGDIQIASNNSTLTPPQFFWVNLGATVNAHTSKIYSNALNSYSGITILGRLRTQHPNGLYNGTVNATFSTNITDNLDYFLSSTSTIEYNASTNQIITGIGLGKALAFQHKYGNLDINNSGIANTNFAYPTNLPNDSAVMVRTNLVLTNGELNLDDDHVSSNSGGRKIVVENPAITAMQRVNGYIRSEVEDGTGLVKWIMASTTGNHIFHFGNSSTEYIPFTFSVVSGTAGSVFAGTYHTSPLNLPYPPTVTHVRNNMGMDNSANTVDRFWSITTPTAVGCNSNLTFTCTPTEYSGISTLLAQRWVTGVNGWTNPVPGTQVSLANGTSASGITIFPTWWTLSGNSVLLPIKLLSFSGNCSNGKATLSWSTATEINNDHFDIERSDDGITYHFAGRILGAGNSNQVKQYEFTDEKPVNNKTYYKLVQYDYDGQSEDFGPIAINSCSDRHLQIAATANRELLTVDVYTDENVSMKLSLYSSEGKVVMITDLNCEEGETRQQIPLPGISAGLYYLSVTGTTKPEIRKIFIY
ncbi:MAG: hypothetical protein IPP51_09120 [Bacteroidetes bacterium]|nr:hypothetical protein [Bacteroidota bacterium]